MWYGQFGTDVTVGLSTLNYYFTQQVGGVCGYYYCTSRQAALVTHASHTRTLPSHCFSRCRSP